MTEPTYVSTVRIERQVGSLRLAYLPAEAEPVQFGTHAAVAAHYGVRGAVPDPHATTLDYIVASTAGWLVGTLGGALEARKVDASRGKLTADVRGEVELEDGVLVIRRIHVAYGLAAPEDARRGRARARRVPHALPGVPHAPPLHRHHHVARGRPVTSDRRAALGPPRGATRR